MTSIRCTFAQRFFAREELWPTAFRSPRLLLPALCVALGSVALFGSGQELASPENPRPVVEASASSGPDQAMPSPSAPGTPPIQAASRMVSGEEDDSGRKSQSAFAFQADYAAAYHAAKKAEKLLLVLFVLPNQREESVAFLTECLRPFASSCEATVVSPGDTIKTKDGEIQLWEDKSFSELARKPGVALVSFLGGPDDPDYGKVVATMPLGEDGRMGPPDKQRILGLLNTFLAPSLMATGQKDYLAPPGHVNIPDEGTLGQKNDVTLATHLAPILEPQPWLTNYAAGVSQAKREKKMLLVYLYPEADDKLRNQFETGALRDARVLKELVRYVLVRLPESATIDEDGKSVRLLSHPMLSEMEGQPGLFIVDYASEGEKYYGQVVSQFPFLDGRAYTAQEMLAILTLPPGTLTQRTMVFAVRVHPERPRSVLGRPDPFLFAEAEKHSEYQARIRLQGHHFWETRFGRIISALRGQRTASEVCAESWPGQGLLRAALECVRCWRLSPGHWRAVASEHDGYGYDIKRGSNGVWYATGIFVNR